MSQPNTLVVPSKIGSSQIWFDTNMGSSEAPRLLLGTFVEVVVKTRAKLIHGLGWVSRKNLIEYEKSLLTPLSRKILENPSEIIKDKAALAWEWSNSENRPGEVLDYLASLPLEALTFSPPKVKEVNNFCLLKVDDPKEDVKNFLDMKLEEEKRFIGPFINPNDRSSMEAIDLAWNEEKQIA